MLYVNINKNNFHHHYQYGSGSCKGYMGTDLITIQDTPVSVNHTMMFVYYEDAQLDSLIADGILGLSNLKSVKNFLDYAYENGQIKVILFKFN